MIIKQKLTFNIIKFMMIIFKKTFIYSLKLNLFQFKLKLYYKLYFKKNFIKYIT